ncbi:MAG: ATP-binding cassette domain-containing protein, partial [Alphaproteobacteria bacterium]
MSEAALILRDVMRAYPHAGGKLEVLSGANLTLAPGEMVALIGPSGAGKTTLLQIAGLLDRPNAGDISIDGVDAAHARDSVRTSLRNRAIGFVYQFHHL